MLTLRRLSQAKLDRAAPSHRMTVGLEEIWLGQALSGRFDFQPRVRFETPLYSVRSRDSDMSPVGPSARLWRGEEGGTETELLVRQIWRYGRIFGVPSPVPQGSVRIRRQRQQQQQQ